MPIGQEKSSGTWWKVLLGVLGGFVLGIGAVRRRRAPGRR